MPKVSVLMPVYNTDEECLRPAMDSILAQTFTDFEFLILNDASSSPVPKRVVESYGDNRIKYFENTQNLGISASRNKLIDLANGEYLAVMDHDDFSLPDRFAKEVAYLDTNKDVGVVSCNAETFPSKRDIIKPTEDKDIKLALCKSCAMMHPASMIRKSVLDENNIRYEEQFTPAEDYSLWCRLIPFTKFHNIPEVLFKYRWYEKNTSKLQTLKMDAATAAIHALVARDNPGLYAEFMAKAIEVTYIHLFGFIPFLKIVSRAGKTKVYLFNKVLLYSRKTSRKIKK